jgi:O-antigen chain-terminating methyltransferase
MGCKNVLDIGCGRGEFLELLGENGIGCEGVDVNDEMVEYCRKNGLNARKIDAAAYLRGIDNNSLDGIFTDDLIEHLDANYLIRMLRLCRLKLMKGRYMVAKTVNPLSWTSFTGIYLLDMTHKNPLHPETLRFLMEYSGFMEVKVEFVSRLPDDKRLQKVEITPAMSDGEKSIARTYNHNVDRLNEAIFGYENYAAIAKK